MRSVPDTYDCSHLDDAALRRLAGIERWQVNPDGRYKAEIRRRERLRAADPVTAPKRTAEEVLKALDENGRERSEIERFIYRMCCDKPWDYWSDVLVNGGEWGPIPGFDPSGPVSRVYVRQEVDWWRGTR